MFDKRKMQLKAEMNNSKIKAICCTADVWSCRYKRNSYLCITADYVIDNVKNSVTLAMKKLNKSQTGDNLALTMKNILEDYGIFNKVNAFTTDNGANIKKAVKLMDKYNNPFLLHVTNLIIKDLFYDNKRILVIIKKITNVINKIKKSPKLSRELRELQKSYFDLYGTNADCKSYRDYYSIYEAEHNTILENDDMDLHEDLSSYDSDNSINDNVNHNINIVNNDNQMDITDYSHNNVNDLN